ncbi:hypothetical protein [Motiliproteus sp. MSK22-1]|uniref:hypothetical protein n=1 Tax=Motiliproteus sp. MSK22-1 TaxID=1897630 RepID=UPI0009763FAD|nr:hypothetical protein [Motiliproteus sp. MSK22-1]OMH26650.1 hypothetical protein BGP75_23430 [Motiliproteus sp. MSK22-1]
MSQNIEIIDLGFSVADAEDITFKFDGADLVLEFNDWKEKHVTIRCENTLGFKFQNAEYELSGSERFDSCHIVHDSEWLEEHLKQGEAWESEKWLHYKLNFNAAGVVEILCSKLAKT